MTKSRIMLIAGSVAAIAISGLAFGMWVANGIVYGSLAGLKGREHDLAIARERGMIALTAAVLSQAVAMFTTASWLPSRQFSGAAGVAARLVLALVVSVVGAGFVLMLILRISRWTH